MKHLLIEVRNNRVLWLLLAVPVVIAGEHLWPEAHTGLFLLSVLAIIPLAALLSRATEAVAERTGDTVGGLLNATLGNLTELVIALTALKAGQYALVKASIAGAVVTNTLFMLGGAFLLGGLRHHVQEFNHASARFQASLLFVAVVALLVPSAIISADRIPKGPELHQLSSGLAVMLISAYALGLLFSLKTHKDVFASASHDETQEDGWPLTLGLGVLAVVTAFSAARRDRLDLSVGIALGSSVQIALFVAPLLVLLSYVMGPEPMGLDFWPGAVVMMFIAALTAVLVTAGGRSAWFMGLLILLVYAIFAFTLYVVPPLQ